MKKTDKTDNFLNAIKKYSEMERQQIREEIASQKEEVLSKAEEKGRADADRFTKKQLSEAKAQIAGEYAVKNLEAQGALYKTRVQMVEKVFKKAEERLREYTSTPEYEARLVTYAREISEIFSDNECVIYLNKNDLKYSDKIKAVFKGNVQVEADVAIHLGGVKGFCQGMKLVADNTLDSKLEEQKSRFIENANLKVM